MINIRKLETELWEAADLLRVDSKVTSQEYCMPVSYFLYFVNCSSSYLRKCFDLRMCLALTFLYTREYPSVIRIDIIQKN